MAIPRRFQILPRVTAYYHITLRCVRKLKLMGDVNPITKKSTKGRKKWIEKHLQRVAKAFCVDLCSYAIMDNHIHLQLHINEKQAKKLTMEQVIRRWHCLFRGTPLSRRYLEGGRLNAPERKKLERVVRVWRKRLNDISWFMRCFSQYVSRRCNKEDGTKGRFFEERFQSKGLCGFVAIIACMIYIELNPIRAGLAATPETSNFTSLKTRIDAWRNPEEYSADWLFPLNNSPSSNQDKINQGKCLPITLKELMKLVDNTGRAVRTDKRGAIDKDLLPILERLEFDAKQWIKLIANYDTSFKRFVAKASKMNQLAHLLKLRWLQGTKACNQLLPDTPYNGTEHSQKTHPGLT